MVDVDHSWGTEQVNGILNGIHPYGKVQLVRRHPAPGVTFYGSPGQSSSVGQWIRATWVMHQSSTPLKGLWAYWAMASDDPNQKMWYYAIEIGNEFHVVGGCTDFSGEGGNARRIAAAYQHILGLPVETRPVSDLISYLIEGWYPYLSAKENFLDDDRKDEDEGI